MAEIAMELVIASCIRCGADPEDQKGGSLENIRVVKGVMTGDNVCLDYCLGEMGAEDSCDILAFIEEGA